MSNSPADAAREARPPLQLGQDEDLDSRVDGVPAGGTLGSTASSNEVIR